MPIYEYKCLKCGKTFEVLQKVSAKSSIRCKFCKGAAERLISNSSFQLKGSGWYVTDYARKPGGDPAKPSESGDKPADKTGDKPGPKGGESPSTPSSTPDKGSSKKKS